MKKVVKWIGIAVLTPLLLCLLLAILIYLPPVQNWAVRKVAAVASEKTGMEITVGHVSLAFPLDLQLDDFKAIKQNDSLPQVKDTIADVHRLIADVRLLPLFRSQVVIDELSFHQARINTNGFISDLRIKGDLQELWLSSKGIDLDKETVEVNGARLQQARLDIALNDTAAADTTPSTLKWRIHADSLTISQTGFKLHLPGDTLNVSGFLDRFVARQAHIDIGNNIYEVGSLDWNNGTLAYDNRFEPETDGFDQHHIAIGNINLGIDRIKCTPDSTSFFVRKTFLREKSGIEVNEFTGGITLDSAYNHIRLPLTTLKTADSNIMAEADIDLTAFDDQNPGQMKVRLFAQLGKQDIERYVGQLPQKFMEHFPNHPLNIRGSINGNMKQLDVTGIDIDLATAVHASIKGKAENVTDLNRMKADIAVNGKTQELNFLIALVDPKMSGTYRIPNGVEIDGRVRANGTRYTTDMTLHEGKGNMKLKGSTLIPLNAKGVLTPELMTYEAEVSINELNIHHFLPKDSIYTLSADIKAKGHATDFFSKQSRLEADANVRLLKYGYMNLDNLTAAATLTDGRAQASLTGHNEIFDGNMAIDMLLNTKKIEGSVSADLKKADLFRMRLVDKQLTIGTNGSLNINTDMKQTHYVSGRLNALYVKDGKKTYNPGDVGILLKLNTDTTVVRAQSGDFILKLDAMGGYEQVLRQANVLSDSIMAQYENRIINQPSIKALLPVVKLHLESKRENPIAHFFRAIGIDFKELDLDLTTSPETGINGQSHIYALNYDSTRIDTIRLNLTQKGDRFTYQGQVRNNRKNPQFVFNCLIDGHVHDHGALAGLRFYDKENKLGMRIGATVDMESDGLRFKLLPQRPTLGYQEFNLNEDNYIFLARNKHIKAHVDLVTDDKTGIKIYTENQDSTMQQDLTVSLNRIDLKRITSVIPYLPRMTGSLNGDYHILQDHDGRFSVASDMAVHQFTYEGSPLGNISTEMVYMMKEDNAHAVEARLMRDDEEFGLLSGTYRDEGEGQIDATFAMTRTPLSLINGFIPDKIIGLEGYGDGTLDIHGSLVHPDVNGEVYVDSAYLISVPYSVRMRFDNDPIRVVGSHLLLENFGLYAYNEEPLNMMGEIDFSDTDHIKIDLRMRAQNLLLINSKQEPDAIAWGKAYVNMFARMQGPLDQMKMRGRLDLLGSSDLTYMLLDSPLSADNRLNELVKFTDFSDSTQTVIVRPTPTGFEADLSVNISQGARIVCYLNNDQSNYVDLIGGGDLRMKYDMEGIDLKGRYTLTSGEMKYSLPVIPLKTFTVKDGSYVEFTGDPYNPKLNITATEQVKATVGNDDGPSRSVLFDCGVAITKTLKDMGVAFTIEAPEDNGINGELATMTDEQRGKLAVGMISTGMYLADGNTGGFSMNSALSSFLQSEINSIAGSALRTLDLSVGIDNTTDATGAMHTDYSFKFAKRFLDNRLKVQIGGKVSTGSTMEGQTKSFFDNVTMEYRLNQDATQYIKVFYKQNSFDWLDGYTSEFGAGFIWRRKMNYFWDIFRPTKKEPQRTMMRRSPAPNVISSEVEKSPNQLETNDNQTKRSLHSLRSCVPLVASEQSSSAVEMTDSIKSDTIKVQR